MTRFASSFRRRRNGSTRPRCTTGRSSFDAPAAIADAETLLDEKASTRSTARVPYPGDGTLLVKVSEDVPILLLGLVGVTTKRVTASAEIVAAGERTLPPA